LQHQGAELDLAVECRCSIDRHVKIATESCADLDIKRNQPVFA
jgi:hypothetical protein